MNNNVSIIIHDSQDETVEPLLNKFIWGNIAASNHINHIYKVGGDHKNNFVPFSDDVVLPKKIVCVMAPGEAKQAGVEIVELNDYKHERDCVYVFGTDDEERKWHKKFESEDTDYITIDTLSNTELYTFTAATLVLYHRWRFLNGGN